MSDDETMIRRLQVVNARQVAMIELQAQAAKAAQRREASARARLKDAEARIAELEACLGSSHAAR